MLFSGMDDPRDDVDHRTCIDTASPGPSRALLSATALVILVKPSYNLPIADDLPNGDHSHIRTAT